MKKKIGDLTPEEQEKVRAYNREQKRRSRANQKAESYIPSVEEWSWNWSENFPVQNRELNAYEQDFSRKVLEELGREFRPYSSPELETLSWVAVTSYCFKKKDSPWVREVASPDGIKVGGLFYPDVLGSDLVANTHRFGLETSATYVALYRELLRILDKKCGHERTEDAAAVRAELAGTYVYVPPQPKLVPKSEPKPELKPDVVTPVAEPKIEQPIPNVNWSQLNKDLDEQARRFLDGIR